MKRCLVAALAIALLASSGACLLADAPQPLTSKDLQKIHFEQRLDQQISLDLPFIDEQGRDVQLKQYFGERPVILVLGYYECPMLCGLVLNGLLEALKEMKGAAGSEFSIVCVSIDPSEGPRLAAAKKAAYLTRYLRPGAAEGWHFLTGRKEAIGRLADEVGFQFAYDWVRKEYAHPSGIVVLTPQGKVSRYFFGVNYSSKQLETAVKDAAWNRVGARVQEFLFLCFHYTPFKGRYGQQIMTGIRIGGFLTLAGLGGVIWWGWRSERETEGRLGPGG